MTRRFGREATTYLAEPLLAGIHAGDVDRLSLRALFPAIRRRRTEARQPDSRLPPRSGDAFDGWRVQVAARRSERDGPRARQRAARRHRSRTMPSSCEPAGGRTAGSASRPRRTGASTVRSLVLSTPAYVTGRAPSRARCRACPALRGDPLLVDRDRRAGVSAGGRRASFERIRVRRAADRRKRYPRRDVAVVEVAAPGARGTRPAANVSRAARAIPRRSINRTAELVASIARRASGRCSGCAATLASPASIDSGAPAHSTKWGISIG